MGSKYIKMHFRAGICADSLPWALILDLARRRWVIKVPGPVSVGSINLISLPRTWTTAKSTTKDVQYDTVAWAYVPYMHVLECFVCVFLSSNVSNSSV